MESFRAREMENVAVLASVRGYAEGFIRKVDLLEGELAKSHQARQVAEKKVCILLGSSAKGARRLVVSGQSTDSSFRSFPFYVRAVLSCASPLLAHRK
jgi:hypothetical protein